MQHVRAVRNVRVVRAWLAVWLGWTALALFFAISSSLTYRSTGRPANWFLSIARSLSDWWVWALLTPLVAWLARRFPLDRRWPWSNAAIHLCAGAALAIVKTAATRAVFGWLTGIWTYWLVSTFALEFFVYASLVAATHGLGYYRRSREREQIEARLAETRLQLLGMQLQPHFLFNTLNTIAELVHDDPDGADYMIAGLSDLLRRSLDLGSTQEIPLDMELDLLSRYLGIQQARFGERLQVHTNIGDDARGAVVPVLLLQPLVENAIRYGLAQRLASGRIDIAVGRAGRKLIITVTDDGPGAAGGAAVRNERLGLGNTRARLETLYGGEQRLELTDAPGGGARVSLEIPYREAASTGVARPGQAPAAI
jgi:two-component system LytT family sensor kinase